MKQAKFWYNWFGRFNVWVEVSCADFDAETEQLINPILQFFERPNGITYRMCFRKPQFDNIMEIAYHTLKNSPSSKEQNAEQTNK